MLVLVLVLRSKCVVILVFLLVFVLVDVRVTVRMCVPTAAPLSCTLLLPEGVAWWADIRPLHASKPL